jgi:hypothetical protein
LREFLYGTQDMALQDIALQMAGQAYLYAVAKIGQWYGGIGATRNRPAMCPGAEQLVSIGCVSSSATCRNSIVHISLCLYQDNDLSKKQFTALCCL